MAGDRVFNFNGASVTFNDIHDNHNCTIVVPKGRTESDADAFCTYIVPNASKSREEIEGDLVRGSHKSASTFAHMLKSYEKQKFLDFRGESASDIYTYFKDRYSHLSFGLKTFQEAFKAS